jgi:hypothetical protein
MTLAQSAPTTIKVSSATRDRIKEHAQRSDRTIDQYLNLLIDLAERELRWDALREARARMTTTDWASYNAETSVWDATNTDGVTDEAW